MRLPYLLAALLAFPLTPFLHAAPLRVLVAGDAEQFHTDYSAAMQRGGAVVTAQPLPDGAALEKADAVLPQSTKFEALPAAAQAALTAFALRGGSSLKKKKK